MTFAAQLIETGVILVQATWAYDESMFYSFNGYDDKDEWILWHVDNIPDVEALLEFWSTMDDPVIVHIKSIYDIRYL